MIEQESEALRKGIEFEGCVRRMFEGPRFDILVQSDEKGSKIPDFYIKEKERGFKFWVEAKFRSTLVDESIDIFETNKDRLVVLRMFQQIVRPETVFLIIGLGAPSSNPDELYCLPVMELDYPSRFRKALKERRIQHSPFTRYEDGHLYQ